MFDLCLRNRSIIFQDPLGQWQSGNRAGVLFESGEMASSSNENFCDRLRNCEHASSMVPALKLGNV